MTTVLMLCFVACAVFFLVEIKRIAKHDAVLFPFCQLRRDIMRFLYENVFENPGMISHSEYQSVIRLLDVLNDAISNYNKYKKMMFNIRKVAKYLSQYRHAVKQAKPIDLTNNDKIQTFHARFVHCYAKAFLAYTPLIRSELTLRFIAFIYRKNSQYVLAVAKQVRDDKQQGDLLESGATA